MSVLEPCLFSTPLYHRWELGHQLTTKAVTEWDTYLIQYDNPSNLPLTRGYLRQYIALYRAFPDFAALSPELSWTHYRLLLRLSNPDIRAFYLRACRVYGWSVHTLARQLRTRHYERQQEADIWGLKSHYVFELPTDPANEYALEQALCNQLREVLPELGPHFSYLGRQFCLRLSNGQRYFVDMLFYHLQLQAYLLIELKVKPLTHRDIGQLDTYIRVFETRYLPNWSVAKGKSAPAGEQLPLRKPACIGLLLCPGFNPDLLTYSVLADRPQLQVATYKIAINGKR